MITKILKILTKTLQNLFLHTNGYNWINWITYIMISWAHLW